MSTEPRHAVVGYPGGLRASWRWAGSGDGAKVFALTEAGGPLVDLGLGGVRRPGCAVPGRVAGGIAGRAVDRAPRVDDQR